MMISEIQLARFISMCDKLLEQQGFSVVQTADLRLITAVCERLDKPYLTKVLDPSASDYTAQNCFWLVLYVSGEPIGLVGARMDNLARNEFVGFYRRQMTRLYGLDGRDVVDDALFPPPFHEMNGNLVYIGDLFIAPAYRGRDRINLRALLLLLKALSFMKWNHSWVYAFVREAHAELGYLQKYCFAQSYAGAVSWLSAPKERNNSDYFACSRGIDTSYIIEHINSAPSLLSAP